MSLESYLPDPVRSRYALKLLGVSLLIVLLITALTTVTDEYAGEIDTITAQMQPCEHCRTQKYETYVLLTVLRRAFVRAYQGG